MEGGTCPRVPGTSHTSSVASTTWLPSTNDGIQCDQVQTGPGQRAVEASKEGSLPLAGKRGCLEEVACHVWDRLWRMRGAARRDKTQGKAVSQGEGNVCKGWGKTKVSSGNIGT